MCYQILKYKVGCKELGVAYLDNRRKDKILRSYIKRLGNLGYKKGSIIIGITILRE